MFQITLEVAAAASCCWSANRGPRALPRRLELQPQPELDLPVREAIRVPDHAEARVAAHARDRRGIAVLNRRRQLRSVEYIERFSAELDPEQVRNFEVLRKTEI